MKTILKKYEDQVKSLPDSIEKIDILNSNFLIDEEGKLKIYYAPHNEYINTSAKILIVGICPGWTQTKIAFSVAKDGLNNNIDLDSIIKRCKLEARFAGSMRNNLISMLDELELNKFLNIKSVSELFDDNNNLHTTSLLPYPVFINEKNYTGHSPNLVESTFLMKYIQKHFYNELSLMDNEVLIIPLGKAVEDVLKIMVKDGVIKEKQCLFGFPHPSGANGHRLEQFKSNKASLKRIIKDYFQK